MRFIIFSYLLSVLLFVGVATAHAETMASSTVSNTQALKGTLEKGVPFCLTDDLLAKFNMATPAENTFPYEQGNNVNDTIRNLEQSGKCAINGQDEVPITIFGNDKGKKFPCGDQICTGNGGLVFIRIHMPDGKTKEVWVNSGTPELSVVSKPQVITIPRETPTCPTLSLFMKFFMADIAGSVEKKKPLFEKGCSVTDKDATIAITVLKVTDNESAAYMSASYPDGTTHNFWTYHPKDFLPDGRSE